MEKNAPFTTKILATFPEDFIEKEFSVSICWSGVSNWWDGHWVFKVSDEIDSKAYYEVETSEKSTSNWVQISYWKHADAIAELPYEAKK